MGRAGHHQQVAGLAGTILFVCDREPICESIGERAAETRLEWE